MPSADVLERRNRAVQLRREGFSYDAIAVRLGYANRAGAWKAVQSALSSHEAESVDELRAVEVDRLDAVQAAHWDRAMDGDLRSAYVVLRCICQRILLLGLVPDRKPGRKQRSAPGEADGARILADAAFWVHVREHHAGDWRAACRCPEITGQSIVAREDEELRPEAERALDLAERRDAALL